MNITAVNGKSRIVAGVAAVAMAGALALAFAVPAHAATATLKGSATTATKYSKPANMGKTVGAAKASGKALKGIKITMSGVKGTVSYKVFNGGSYKGAKNGKAAKIKSAQAVSVALAGAAKKKYDVYYRVYVPSYGWMGWAKNGAKAGTKVAGKFVSAYQVKLIAKGKKLAAYNTTNAAAYTDNANFFKLTGDAAADAQVVTLTKGKTLEGAFNTFVNKMQYGYNSLGTLAVGSFPTARLVKEGKNALTTYRGDCYTFSGGLYYLATYLGYKATPISGKLLNKNGVWNANSWCEIEVDCEVQIWNPQLQNACNKQLVNGKIPLSLSAVDKDGHTVVAAEVDESLSGDEIPYATAKTYGFAVDSFNDYEKTIATRVFTGYGYKK